MPVDRSELGVHKTLRQLGITKSTFYKWYNAYLDKGPEGLEPEKQTRQQWNAIPEAKTRWWKGSWSTWRFPTGAGGKDHRRTTVYIFESSVYRILRAKGLATTPQHVLLSAAGAFKDKMCFVHRIWQTDFTYFKVGVGMVITAPRF